MSTNTWDWRPTEPSRSEVIRAFPDVSPFVIVKTDLQRRGVRFSADAKRLVDPELHAVEQSTVFTEYGDSACPSGMSLSDGTSLIYFGETIPESSRVPLREPYLVDAVDGKPWLFDGDEAVHEVEYWPKPAYFHQKTSSGVPMWRVFDARHQRLDLSPNRHCHFWDEPGHGCKYCPIGALSKDLEAGGIPSRLDLADISETMAEALRQPGRFTSVCITGGSILSGAALLDDELELYIRVLQAIGRHFWGPRFPSQLIATAFDERQLERLHRETGLASFTADIEVLDEGVFNQVCPGKARHIGYREWKRRLVAAVGIFGRGSVNTGLVSGVELARPAGFASEAEAHAAVMAEAEELIAQGVGVAACVWVPAPGSALFRERNPSLEYYVRQARDLDRLHRAHALGMHFDDYRRCGNHPNSDLARS